MTQVNELVEKGMVQPSSCPFFSLVLLVQNKDGSYYMCVDYHAVNNNTKNHSQFQGLRIYLISFKGLPTLVG